MTATLTLPYSLLPIPTPPDERPGGLVALPVATTGDALIMGRIRDRQRATFTGDTSPITDAQQRVWWARHRYRIKAWLYADAGGALVGYGALLQQEDGRWVSSVAIVPGQEGRGYGSRILSHMVNAVEHPIHARALLSNPPACHMHNAREWETVSEDGECRYFVTRPRVVDRPVDWALAAYDDDEPRLPHGWRWEGAK